LKALLTAWARRLKAEALTLWHAGRHPDTPWYAKAVALFAAAYAFSPIDLIPDFIPVLGYLDDLILLPLLIALAIHLTPTAVWRECRQRAESEAARPTSRTAAGVIVALWLVLAAALVFWLLRVQAGNTPVER
jgi:uncharacterized membrane protein YkvA (DUF1232 family)